MIVKWQGEESVLRGKAAHIFALFAHYKEHKCVYVAKDASGMQDFWERFKTHLRGFAREPDNLVFRESENYCVFQQSMQQSVVTIHRNSKPFCYRVHDNKSFCPLVTGINCNRVCIAFEESRTIDPDILHTASLSSHGENSRLILIDFNKNV